MDLSEVLMHRKWESALLILGGGRETKESVIDPTVGLVFSKKVADPVKKGDDACNDLWK